MTPYLITYDNHPPRDYGALYKLMEIWDAVRLAESVWLVTLTCDASIARNAVQSLLETNDTVAVIELVPNSDWATNCVAKPAINWLSQNVTPAAPK